MEAILEISSKNLRTSSFVRMGTKQAWAAYVRRRFYGEKLLHRCMDEWDLTEGEARGLIYTQVSQRTIDKIKHHKRGGWRVALEIEALIQGEALANHIERERDDAARQYAEMDRHHREMVESLRALGGLAYSGRG